MHNTELRDLDCLTGLQSLTVYSYFHSLVSNNQTCHQGHPEIPEHVAQSLSILVGAPGHRWPLTDIFHHVWFHCQNIIQKKTSPNFQNLTELNRLRVGTTTPRNQEM